MKYLKLFENFVQSEIDDICKQYGITNYTINSDGSIDVDGNINLNYKSLYKLPLKFNRVSGWFDCTGNHLTSLEGCPKYVGSGFSCSTNKLTNLEGCPNYVGRKFMCCYNDLTSLEGCPSYIGSDFDCSNTNITSLEGCPYIRGEFEFDNTPISSLIIDLFDYDVNIYLDYQETYNFLRKDCKIIKHLLEEALKDYNEYYNRSFEIPEKIEGYTYI
jgi:hypothetical protein